MCLWNVKLALRDVMAADYVYFNGVPNDVIEKSSVSVCLCVVPREVGFGFYF